MSILGDYSPTRPMKLFDLLTNLTLMKGSVVLEGLDCVGKTTTAKMLTEGTNRPLLTPQRLPEIPLALRPHYDYFALGQYKAFFDFSRVTDVVIDRCHLSAHVFGRKSWTDVRFCEAGRVGHIKGVYLYADEEIVKRRMREKGEPIHLFEKYAEHRTLYEEALRNSEIDFIKLNTSLLTL